MWWWDVLGTRITAPGIRMRLQPSCGSLRVWACMTRLEIKSYLRTLFGAGFGLRKVG